MRILQVVLGLSFSATAICAGAQAGERMVGVISSDGNAMLAKRFAVPAGTSIVGVEFQNNDPVTIFPEVLLVRDPGKNMSNGSVVGRATDVSETTPGWVHLAWANPVQATQSGYYYYIGVRMPAGLRKQGPGNGPALGAVDVVDPNGSFLASGPEGELAPIAADLRISLLTAGSGKATTKDAAPSEHVQTFLGAGEPNPTGAVTRIHFGVEHRAHVALAIYSVAGQRIRALVAGPIEAGVYSREWDARDDEGHHVAAGIYFVKLETDGKVFTQKLVLMR